MAAPAICLFFNTLIKACSSTIGPRDALINRAVGFILSSSAAPTRPRVRLLNTKWIVRISARSNSWSLETRIAPAALAASGVMFWLQAIRFIPKALPTRATCDPIRPSPRTPRVFPRRSRRARRAVTSRPSPATHFDNRLGWLCGSFPSHSLQQGPARFADFHPYELGVLDAAFVGNQKAAIGRNIEHLLVAGRSSEGAGRAPDHTLFGACQCCASA